MTTTSKKIQEELASIRESIINENISYGELARLQYLVPYIPKDDVVLLEAAGVPEFPTT